MKQLALFLSLSPLSLFALGCSDYKDFTEHNGHYYTVTVDKLKFNDAQQIAENNNGYLAIPNNQAENDFIQGLTKGTTAWIGIHDPNYIQNWCYDSSQCIPNDSRFKTVKGDTLAYKNWYTTEPNNLVKPYDEVDGKQMVSPIGEYWVALSGNNGKWYDIGNHADEYNNPVKYHAVYEFDEVPDCYLTDDSGTEWTGEKCNTQIWDTTTGILENGNTFDCLTDSHDNSYCPSALADATQSWDYEDGYSVEGIGSVTDYTSKITETIVVDDSYSATKRTQWKITFPDKLCAIKNSDKCYFKDNDKYYAIGTETQDGVIAVRKAYTCSDSDLTRYDSDGIVYEYAECLDAGYSCPNGGVLNGNICSKVTTTTVASCPSGYTETTGAETAKGECKRTIEYTYYEYKCNSEPNTQAYDYVANILGGDDNRIDSDSTSTNANTLDDTANSSTPPQNNCAREKFTCQYNEERPPVYVDNKWQCSPFPCFGGDDVEDLDTEVGKLDKDNDGWEEDGSCAGTIYIFNGKSNACRAWDLFFGLAGGGCCDKDKVFFGLIACKANEKLLAKKREEEHTHYIGRFCSKKLPIVGTCIQKKDSYCQFNSKLARIINEQGRDQLGIDWGSAESPNCRGFTPQEFQKIDFSQVDLSEFTSDLQSKMNTDILDNMGTFIQDKVESFYEN